MEVQVRPINTIKPYDKNPRLNDAAVDAAANRIMQFWFDWRDPRRHPQRGGPMAGPRSLRRMTTPPCHRPVHPLSWRNWSLIIALVMRAEARGLGGNVDSGNGASFGIAKFRQLSTFAHILRQ
jgi:hypothetical protein